MKKFFNILFFILLTNFLFGQKVTNTSGNWNVAGNWVPSGVPANSDNITVNHQMNTTGTILINNNGTLTVNQSIIDPPGGTNCGLGGANFAVITIDAYSEFYGSCVIQNSASLTIKGCDTLYIHGSVVFRDNCVITIEPCAVLKIDGNLTLQNNNVATVDGTIDVGGNITSNNNASVSGGGAVYADGTITTNNASSFFGSTSNCTTGPCEANQTNGIGGLPVDLLSFTGEHYGWEVILNWETLTELNNDYFEIEASSNGINWDRVGYVKGWGNSNTIKKYKWIDNDPYIQTYYRLKQVDYDGKSEYVGMLYLNYIQPTRKEINVNPNPVKLEDNINVQLMGFKGEEVLLVLLDALGNEHYSKFILVNSDTEVYVICIDKRFKSGIYVIKGTSKNELYNKKIVIK